MPRDIRVGDMFRIRDDIESFASHGCNPDMIQYAGSIATVTRIGHVISPDSMMIDIDDGEWRWGESDLLPITELRVGDRVRIRSGFRNEPPVFGIGTGMIKYEGDLVTISGISDDECTPDGILSTAYFIEEDGEEFYWGFSDFVITAEREEAIDRVAVTAVWEHFKEKF